MFRNSWLITCLLLLILAKPAAAQQGQQNIDSLIRHKDSLFWKAYNNCDLNGMNQFFSTDLEFYHDKGGITLGSENLIASTKKGLCGTPGYHLRREAIAETVKVFPMQANGQVYGALISGEHLFYITDKGQPEYLDGHARFTQLWVLREGEWKMSRILSYDHKPASDRHK